MSNEIAYGDVMDTNATSSGHSRALRRKLALARGKLGLTQAQVAERIAAATGKPLSLSSVSAWENFVRHPQIDHFAAWCRILGYRLIVDIDDADSSRVPVLVSPGVAELARALDLASPRERELAREVLARMLTPR